MIKHGWKQVTMLIRTILEVIFQVGPVPLKRHVTTAMAKPLENVAFWLPGLGPPVSQLQFTCSIVQWQTARCLDHPRRPQRAPCAANEHKAKMTQAAVAGPRRYPCP